MSTTQSKEIAPAEIVDTALYNLHAVKSITSLSTATIYRLLNQKRLVQPKRIGKAVRWLGSDLRAWINGLTT